MITFSSRVQYCIHRSVWGKISSPLSLLCLSESLTSSFFGQTTVFDLISGLFAYVIFGKKNALISEPPWIYFYFFGIVLSACTVQFPLSFIYFVCVYPGCKTLREGRKSLFWQVYIIVLQDDRYNTILSALETITKTAMRSLSWWPPQINTYTNI